MRAPAAAFSGAARAKPGLFELATGGTLFPDEVGELPRVRDRMPYYRLGGTRKITVDTRVLAATNRDREADQLAPQPAGGRGASELRLAGPPPGWGSPGAPWSGNWRHTGSVQPHRPG